MDHYKLLGVHKNASKEEIKQAFRKLAMQFHPDKHSQSSRDSATHKFKQLSEAYDILIDDRKRADYNLKRNAYGAHQSNRSDYQHGRGHGGASGGYGYSNPYGYGYGYSGFGRRSGSEGIFDKFEIGLRFLTTRSFLLNATYFSILLGGMFLVDASGKALWRMRNAGKSFEEAMESVEKAKAGKDNSY